MHIRLSASVCNNRQRWNENKCRCECKELIGKRICDKGFISNPSIVSVNVINDVALGNIWIIKIVCRNSIVDTLFEEYTKIVDENKIYNETLKTISSSASLSDCVSRTTYIVLFTVFLVTSVIIGGVFVFIGIRKK